MPEEVQRREAPSDTADAPSSLDPSVDDSSPDQEALPTLERMERHLAALHGAIDAHSRERAHREFSPARLAGAILEVMVGGLVVLALLDWLLQVCRSIDSGQTRLCGGVPVGRPDGICTGPRATHEHRSARRFDARKVASTFVRVICCRPVWELRVRGVTGVAIAWIR